VRSRYAIITGRGGPEVLEIAVREAPLPGRGEVRIAVEAAGVAFGDVVRRRGVMAPRRPFTPGYDVVGVVDAAGAGVDPGRVGKRVAAMMPSMGIGGYAEHVCLPAARLVDVAEGVDPAIAVCLGLNYITAYQLLYRIVPMRQEQKLLVHGAAGGVGTALLDIGRGIGLDMYGTASAGKHALLRERGATPIDYRTEDFVARMKELVPDGVDAVFDPIGGAHLRRSYQTLGPRGVLVSFGVGGDLDRGWPGVLSGMLVFVALKLRFDRRRVRFYGIGANRGTGWRHCRDDWAELLARYRRGELDPVVGARVPLDEVRRAHELIDGAAVVGKIVLVP
jgi:NADPH2:quinone reductase